MESICQIVHDPLILGEQLRLLRKSRGLTVEGVATRVSLSKGYISLLESGKRTPHWMTLMRILHALDETLCSFLTRGGNLPQPEEGTYSGRDHLVVVAGSEPDEWGITPDADTEGYTWILTPHRQGGVSEVIRFRLPPHSAWTPDLLTLPAHGTTFGLEGKILLEVEDNGRNEFLVGTGEVLQHDLHSPHRFRNPTDLPAEVLLTLVPPVF